jgi:hypothetical protein
VNRENKTIIKALNMYGRVPEQWELLEEIERLNNRINKAIEYIENNSLYEEEYDYDYEENMHLVGTSDEVAKNDLLSILKGNGEE